LNRPLEIRETGARKNCRKGKLCGEIGKINNKKRKKRRKEGSLKVDRRW